MDDHESNTRQTKVDSLFGFLTDISTKLSSSLPL